MKEEHKELQRHLHLINNSFYGRTNIDTFKTITTNKIEEQQ